MSGRRLFVAIALDDDARRAIARAQDEIAKTVGGSCRSSIKWVKPEHMHLTLAFLGNVDEARVPDVSRAIATDIPVPPFVARFGGFGVFPPRGAPRVLWMGVGEGAADIAAIQQEVAARTERAGVAIEARPFHPHLTLARWRESRSSDARFVADGDRGAEIAHVLVEKIILFESQLSPSGPTYRALAHAALTPARS